MKNNLFNLFAIISLIFSSCSKDLPDSPGNIPGMGTSPDNFVIRDFYELPKGIYLVDQIKEPDLKDTVSSKFGSGKNERLKIALFNSNTSPRTVFFPKGLIFKNSVPGYHNGVLLQTTWVTVEAGARREIIIEVYCINSGLLHDNQDSHFNFLGIPDSPTFSRLLELISWRKINYEMIYGTFKGSQLAVPSGPAYSDITARLQTIVWNLTDIGISISVEDQKFIESIPMLFNDEIPPVDEVSSRYPEFFHEFKVLSN